MTNRLGALQSELAAQSAALARKEMELQEALAQRDAARRQLRIQRELHRAILAAASPVEIGRVAVSRLREILSCRLASITLYDY